MKIKREVAERITPTKRDDFYVSQKTRTHSHIEYIILYDIEGTFHADKGTV